MDKIDTKEPQKTQPKALKPQITGLLLKPSSQFEKVFYCPYQLRYHDRIWSISLD